MNSAAFWTEAAIQPQNDYTKTPEFEELDDEIIQFTQGQVDSLGVETGAPPNVRKQANWTELLFSLLFDVRVYGFTMSELIWEVADGTYRLKAVKVKPPWNFELKVDEADDLEYVDHYIGGLTNLEPERFLIGTWPELKYGNYYGTSDLQSVIHDIEAIQIYEKQLLKGASLSLYRPILAWANGLGLSASDLSAYINAIDEAESASVIHLPMYLNDEGKIQKGFEVEILPDRASPATIQQVWTIIQEYIKRINRELGVPDELGQVTVAVGSYAKSKTQFDVFLSRVEQCQRWVTEIANRIIHTIIYYNFQNLPEGYKIPCWEFQEIEESYLNDRASYFTGLIQAGILKPGTEDEDFIRQELKLPPRSVENIQSDTNTTPLAPQSSGFFSRLKRRQHGSN